MVKGDGNGNLLVSKKLSVVLLVITIFSAAFGASQLFNKEEIKGNKKAIEEIKSHDDVVLANFCGEPRLLPMALMDRARELSGVRLFHMAVHGPFQEKYLEPGMEQHIKCATPFCGRSKSVRQLLREARADFYPVTFANIPRLLREGDFCIMMRKSIIQNELRHQ